MKSTEEIAAKLAEYVVEDKASRRVLYKLPNSTIMLRINGLSVGILDKVELTEGIIEVDGKRFVLTEIENFEVENLKVRI